MSFFAPITFAPGQLHGCPAPAKLNLFLHVTGRRADGYHLLQTAFRLLDWGDTLDFSVRTDGEIHRTHELPGVPEASDLVIKAARRLQAASGSTLGADITVHKRLPMGGGLGGGSSDAATTLMALDHLWGTRLGEARLRQIGLALGADVPFFIYGRDAFAAGVGEVFQPLEHPPGWYVIVAPAIAIATAEIFSAQDLTRNTPPIKVRDFTFAHTGNDLQAVACSRYPEVAEVITWLEQFAPARMTGSGSCVFAGVDSGAQARRIMGQCPTRWQAWAAASLARHPLLDLPT
ncbi:4-diphosphocytidyl-2-C-methyl-D-erythritol kinase [Betaproteobacteria bacterium]|nr:4-diphosphocytidyl-2-C-methyl-D-erythritol kinase [Betaproteobacteria bacterium]GHU24710.1 4-diphosphocytidyl-2-C-methyl-D-erythritol kinase [Betaproteobacteria bacterium]GHU29417.1 4-diphosphocytidyl-2-C-methyl-D-erythritol kinase [Betaproteobacteria bacterium]